MAEIRDAVSRPSSMSAPMSRDDGDFRIESPAGTPKADDDEATASE